ncbi:MAG: TIGR01777 family oxidoreductase [Chitinophagaceae bacterium]
MATVLITGGTGLIGSALTELLVSKGYDVIILTRHPKAAAGKVSYAAWDPAKQTIDARAIQQADYIVNLAGAGVADKRWSKRRKKELVDSRVQSGQLIVKALQETPGTVKAVVSAAAIGWYGDDEKRKKSKEMFTEEDPAFADFLGDTCKQWEESIEPVGQSGIRLVKYRFGIVLSHKGGAFKEFMKPVRLGFATFFGGGKQFVSWIHIDDACRLILYAIENKSINGVYNAVAPHPASNKTLMTTLATLVKGRFFTPFYVPAFLLKVALGEMSIEVLKSATVSSEKISNSGFQFSFPTLEAALRDLVKK